jgi:hypothetical protein
MIYGPMNSTRDTTPIVTSTGDFIPVNGHVHAIILEISGAASEAFTTVLAMGDLVPLNDGQTSITWFSSLSTQFSWQRDQGLTAPDQA